MMNWGVGIVKDGGSCPEILLIPLLKGPCRLPFVLLITLHPITPVSDNSLWNVNMNPRFIVMGKSELGVKFFKAFRNIQSWFTRTTFTDPWNVNITFSSCFSPYCSENSAPFCSWLHAFPIFWAASLCWPVILSCTPSSFIWSWYY